MIDIQFFCPTNEIPKHKDKFTALVYSWFDADKHRWITKPIVNTETNIEEHSMLHAQFTDKKE